MLNDKLKHLDNTTLDLKVFPNSDDLKNAFKSIRKKDMQNSIKAKMDKSGWFGKPSPYKQPIVHHKEDPHAGKM